MASLLSSLKTDDSIQQEQDRLGGGSFVLESGVYNCTINHAYLQESKGGAIGLVLSLNTEDGREIRQNLWMTSGAVKGRLNYYVNQKGDKQYLPGFLLADSLALLSAGKSIAECEEETKMVKSWNPEVKAEVPTQVQMLMDLVGKEITVGLHKVKSYKQVQLSDGTYGDSDEERETNEIDKFFRTRDGKTTAEIRAGSEEAKFINDWKSKWEGVTKDLTMKKTGGAIKSPVKVQPATNTRPTASLFN